jgi:hypothetical protein
MNNKWGSIKSKKLPKNTINSLQTCRNILADEPIVYLSKNNNQK